MNTRPLRGGGVGSLTNRSPQPHSRVLLLSIGFIFGAIISTIIQNISDIHIELYHSQSTRENLPDYEHSQHTVVSTSSTPTTTHTTSSLSCTLPDRCGIINYGLEDPITAASAISPSITSPRLLAWNFKDLRVDLSSNGTATKYTISESCYNALGKEGSDGTLSSSMPNVTSNLVASVTSEPDHASNNSKCKIVNDNVLIISDTLGRAPSNIFDELAVVWYHYWLIKRATGCASHAPRNSWSITHLNDVLNDMPPGFPQRNEYMKYGTHYGVPFINILTNVLDTTYIPWPDLVKSAPAESSHDDTTKTTTTTTTTTTTRAPCIIFKRAATTGSAWLWLHTPIPSQNIRHLQLLVDAITDNLVPDSRTEQRMRRCRHRVTYATRSTASSRRVINENQVVKQIKKTLPHFDVKNIDLGTLDFAQQIKTVLQTDIYIFPHGGAGPHTLWLPHGAVAIELFPYADADPMYRNLAVSTGSLYLSWQAPSFARPFDRKKIGPKKSRDVYHFTNASDFEVDVEEFKSLLIAAAAMVRNTLGTNWFPSLPRLVTPAGENEPYTAFLCTMCPYPQGRNHTCHSGGRGPP